MAVADPARDRRVRDAIDLIRRDAREEEDILLAELREAAGLTRLRIIGAAWELTRRGAPNLPHPRVSRQPWQNVLAGLWLSVSDRIQRLLGRGRR